QAQDGPVESNEDPLAFPAQREVGQRRPSLAPTPTRERLRECFYRPLVSSTQNYERWNRNGGRDAAVRASEIWRKTLEEYEQPALEDATCAELEEYVVRRRAELGD